MIEKALAAVSGFCIVDARVNFDLTIDNFTAIFVERQRVFVSTFYAANPRCVFFLCRSGLRRILRDSKLTSDKKQIA